MEAVERERHLRPDASGTGRSGRRDRHADDRCDASEDAPHSLKPGAEKGGRGRLIGRTKGGMNSKLHAVTDAAGRPLRMFLTAGQRSDYIGARALLDGLPPAEHMVADRGYDSDWYREAFEDKGITPCIPSRKSRKVPIPHDEAVDFHPEVTRVFHRELTHLQVMFRGSGFGQGMSVLLGFPCSCGRTCLEAEAVVSGLQDVAAMGEPIEQRGGHLGVAEDGGPFAEAQIGGDDDTCAFVEFAEQMKEQRAA